MRIRRRMSVVMTLALVAGMVACQQPAEQQGETGAVDTAAVMAAIDSVGAAAERAYNEGDVGKAADFFHPELMYSPMGDGPIQGRDSVVAFENRNLPPGATIDFEPIETRIFSDEWAYSLGTATFRFTPEGADEEQSVTATYLDVFRHTEDGWKIYRSVVSAN